MSAELLRRLSSPSGLAASARWGHRMWWEPHSIDRELARTLRSGAPLVVGPWLSEIGFEVLYWIPMLNRLWTQHEVPPERVTVISRGGAAPWYGRLGANYVDVLDHMAVDELHERQEGRHLEEGGQKHFALSSLDREILRRASAGLPNGYRLVHPSTMYGRFLPYFASRRSWRLVNRRVTFRRLPEPAQADFHLPKDYVAIKAYFSDGFSDSEANRAFLSRLVERLTQTTTVVLLSTGLPLDEHRDALHSATRGRVVGLADRMTARDNLAVQTAVIAGARALLCTYGGFAYLGPFLGIPTFSFFSEANFNPNHLDAAHRAARHLDGRGVVTAHVRDFEALLRLGAPR